MTKFRYCFKVVPLHFVELLGYRHFSTSFKKYSNLSKCVSSSEQSIYILTELRTTTFPISHCGITSQHERDEDPRKQGLVCQMLNLSRKRNELRISLIDL